MSSDSAALHLAGLSRAGSRPTTPSDLHASSEGFQSPSSSEYTSLQIPDTPISPLVEPEPERAEREEDSSWSCSVPLPDSPDTLDAHMVTEHTQTPSAITVEMVVEEPSPPDTNEDTEYIPRPSRSSISTLVPIVSAVPVISIPDEEPATSQPHVPIVSLSPPPSSEDITFSESSSVPEEFVSSQQDEQIVPTEPSPTTTVHPSSPSPASPDHEPLHEVDASVDVEDRFIDVTNSGNTSITETVTDVLNDYTTSPEKNKSVDMSPALPLSANHTP
ncbi:hypothetical protein AMATHDRAFT_9823 [Amanita thiersii Skay4041]|uniref:Uncharacterized protein n=1 Tax=Amanita thiersii Skay4041 TaxID=703135 RepID=A0A2A9N874_9AGAR|nr:hypothetical protein AMATHDRAFT_9823 [Amanita thiersii Skay4041]